MWLLLPLRLDKFGLSKATFFKGDPIFRPPHGLSMVISQSHRQVNVSVTIVVHTVLLYMYTTDLEAPKSISGQCHCQAVACCVVTTKQLKVRLINKITGILASKFKRRRFVAMDSPQKGNDDFDRSLSLFSLSCATGEHDDDNRTIPKNNQTIMGNQSSRIAMIGKKISIKTPQQLFKLVYSQVVFW